MAHGPQSDGVHQDDPAGGVGEAAAGFDQALRANQPLEILVGELRLETRRLGIGLGLQVIAARPRRAALPVREIRIRAALAGAHRRAVDRLLKALRELHLGGLAAALDHDLSRDIAPRNDDQRGHYDASALFGMSARGLRRVSPPR